MRELQNIKSYDLFMGDLLTEDLIHGEQDLCNRAFVNSGTITLDDGSTVEPKDIISVVNNAISYLYDDYRRTFRFAQKTMNIIYLAYSEEVKTMAVDENMNMYVNAGFVFKNLKMDYKLVAAVIMHEVLHILYNHIERGSNWLAAKGKQKTRETWHDTNLAADIEVNHTLVKIDIITRERLVNEIHGLYLDHPGEGVEGRDRGSINYDIVPMEMILDNEEYMKRLREMCPPEDDLSSQSSNKDKPEEIKTSPEWDQGYKDAWNKIADLIDKYGVEGTWNKLIEAGIINGIGEILKDKIMDVNKIQYLTVKSYDDFIVENRGIGQSYDDGFNTAFGKLVNTIRGIIQGNDDDNNNPPPPPGGPIIKSDLPEDELKKIKLPPMKKKNKSDNSDDGNKIPENIEQESSDDNDNDKGKDDKSGSGYGKGGNKKSPDELTDDEHNKLADDINKNKGDVGTIKDDNPEIIDKSNGGGGNSQKDKNTRNGNNNKSIGVGGTGSFVDKNFGDGILKDAGYSKDEIDMINKVRKSNAMHNTKEKIRREIENAKREMKGGAHRIFGQYFDAIDKESEKYRNIWKKVLEEFMSKRTRRAGADTPTGHNDWKNKKTIARGEYGIHHKMESQDPQDVNVYVDVSGSVDMRLLEIIAKTLVVFTQEWEYSGLNICPWASYSGDLYKISEFYEKDISEITSEILTAISDGSSSCGGGTDVNAMVSAILNAVTQTLDDDDKDEKDDIHIVITDGQFNYDNVEAKMKSAIQQTFHRADVANNAPKNTIWMIYDAPESLRDGWINEINEGKLIFLNTEVTKNNG